MMKRFELPILFALLIFALILAPACGDDDDDNDDDAEDDDDSDDDDDTGSDDDDDNTPPLPGAQVTVAEAPEGNPLARKLTVVTDSDCSLSGYVTTTGETGYGPSVPAVSEEGATHEFWFYGLLENTTFDYTFYLAGEPQNVVVTGSFDAPVLPEERPVIDAVSFDDTAAASDWFSIWAIDSLTWGGVDVNVTAIYDRRGRLRMYHLNEDSHAGWNEVLSNGDVAFQNNEKIMALKLDGTIYDLFEVQPEEPYFKATHHQFYLEDYDDTDPYVLYNEVGDGVECDLTTPTDSMIGDGVLQLNAAGEEVWRWSLWDHEDEIPQTDMEPANCLIHYWGADYSYWSHFNSVVPVPDQDALLISSRNLMRLIKIDRNTGDILWQMGPDGIGDFTWEGSPGEEVGDYWFRVTHDAQYVSPTRILVFDNSVCRDQPLCVLGFWSRALEFEIDEEAKTVSLVWEHRVGFAASQGNVERHENGNTLIGTGGGMRTIEVTPDGDEIFYMKFAQGNVRSLYYPSLWVYEDVPTR